MNREEAINVIKGARKYLTVGNPIWNVKKVDEAFDMAIEALKGRPKGEWVLVKGSNGKDYHKCSKCLHTQEITGVKNYCAVCGARMKGGAE